MIRIVNQNCSFKTFYLSLELQVFCLNIPEIFGFMDHKFTVYKTTNLINEKFYIGFHKTSNPHDDYLGSGKLLKRSIEKYGPENFKKEVLFIFETSDEAYAKEKELVAKHLGEHLCMNLTEGGFGSFYAINTSGILQSPEWVEHLKNISAKGGKLGRDNFKKMLKNNQYKENFSNSVKEGQQKAIEEGRFNRKTFLGKKHTNETKSKIGNKSKIHQAGKKNSQYGSFWITNGDINKKCRGDIPEGFWKGRKC